MTFATRREADGYLAGVQADMLRGQWTPPERATVTLADYWTAWLRQRTPHLRPRTIDLYERTAARWLLAPVGTGRLAVDLAPLALAAISAPLVREWFAAVTLAARTSAQPRPTSSATPATLARAWATTAGLEVAATGRLPRAVVTAWHAAGRPETTTTPAPDPDAGRTAAAQAYRLLHAVLAQAVTDELLTTNPARIPGAGRVHHPERIPLTPAEVTALAEAVPAHLRAAVLTAAWSGLRPGEVFALRRRDLDLAAHRLSVRRTLVEVPGQPTTFGPPKTDAGRRTVALPAFVTAALAAHLAEHTDPGPDALVFTSSTGRPISAGARSTAMSRARDTIDRPDATWHHLRHTGATLAAQAGATQAELQRRIGHASTRAAALYQHASAERDA
ncbi:tyrosine-type recombinase/integrase, partial [Flavimobilis sp. GY10621]